VFEVRRNPRFTEEPLANIRLFCQFGADFFDGDIAKFNPVIICNKDPP
jgi:hypothetical protein